MLVRCIMRAKSDQFGLFTKENGSLDGLMSNVGF